MGWVGEKRNRIRIITPAPVPDGQGGHAVTWVLKVAVWARERALTGAESLRSAQVTAVLTSVWEIWWRGDVSVKDRVLVGAPSLDIASCLALSGPARLAAGVRIVDIAALMDPTDARRELHLVCAEVQTG